MSALRSLSLGAKLNLFLIAFLLLLGAATSAIIIFSFSRTQDRAQERSNAALEEQGKLALQAFVGGISSIGSLQLEAAAETGRRAALYLGAQPQASGATVDTSALAISASGHRYNPDPDRVADLLLISGVDPAAAGVQDDIAFSGPLETAFPILLQTFEGGVGGRDFDPIAIVFISTNGITRYYPPTGIHDVLPADADFTERMTQIGPVNNPDRRTIWTAPYEDGGGQGQIITARTPVYDDGGTFRGSLEVDVSIARLTDQLNGVKPTPRGFAFYVDSAGELLRTDSYDLLTSEAASNPQLAGILAAMQSAAPVFPLPVEKVELQGEEFLLSYTPSVGQGGSVAAAAPVSDITREAALITAGIDDQGTRTLQLMLAGMGALFVVGLAGATYLNRRLLVAPLQRLTAATRQVAGGDLTASVALDRNDELGQLASDFNTMVEQLRESERLLEQRVEDRTRELSTLLEVARNVGSTLELQPLLQLILEQVRTLAPYDRSLVMIREEHALRVIAMRSEPGFEMEPSQMQLRATVADGGLIWELIERGEPAIIEDTRGATPLAAAWRRNNEQVLETALQRVGSWMAVPIRLGDRTIGMLVTSKEERGFFTQRHAELVTAIGTHAGMAINNAQLFEKTQRQARDMEALLRADAELYRSLNLDTVLQSLVDIAVDILGADKSIVVLHQGDIDVVRAARNYAPDSIMEFNNVISTMPHEEPPPDNQTPQVYVDAPAQAPEFVQNVLIRESISSHISVPIKDATRMLGVFGVSFLTEHAFTEDEQRSYVALADRAAVAIQNAELYEKAQQAASLEERQRLARELHDSVSQALYGIALGTRTARMRLGDDAHNAAEPLDYVASLAQAGLAEMRALIFELRPESLEEEGLVAAIEKQAASVAARYKLEVALDLGEEPACSLDAKEALYRITQEALHNIVKHAHAQKVEVTLRQAGATTELSIRDDGRGFDTAASFPGHVGLQSMPERAARLGGTVTIESASGRGTTVSASLPATRP